MDKKARELRSLFLTESSGAKEQALDKTKADIARYLQEVEFWNGFDEPELDGKQYYWKIDNWGNDVMGSHGVLFIGAFCNGAKLLFPVLLLCDEHGDYVDFTENEMVQALGGANDSDIRYFTPSDEEVCRYQKIYDQLTEEMTTRYRRSVEPQMAYNKRKVENWVEIQTEQLNIQIEDMSAEIDELMTRAAEAVNFLEKVDIRKEADEKRKHLQKFQQTFHKKVSAIQEDGRREIETFNKQFDINPILLVNIVLKF